MPASRAPKRSLDIAEAAAHEESDDEDYDDRAPGVSRPRSNRKRRRSEKPVRRTRRVYRGSDIEDDDIDTDSNDDLSMESERDEEVVEKNERGRPLRSAVKKLQTYEETSDEEIDEEDEEEVDEQVDEVVEQSDEEARPPPKATVKSSRSLIVKLKTSPRKLRGRSDSVGGKHLPTSSSSNPRGARRSSRLSHDDEETVVALTNSGNHVEVVRQGSRDPEIPSRAMRGGKGLKYPSKSTIDEELESSRAHTDVVEELEIKASQPEIMDSDGQTQNEVEEIVPNLMSDIHDAAQQGASDAEAAAGDVTVEAATEEPDAGLLQEEDEDEMPTTRRQTRGAQKRKADSPPEEAREGRKTRRLLRVGETTSARVSRSSRRKPQEESSDFDPQDGEEREEDLSSSSDSHASPRKASQRNDESESSHGRRSTRLRNKASSRQSPVSEPEEEELAAELKDLKRDGKRKRSLRAEISFEPRGRRNAGRPNYDLMRGLPTIEDEEEAVPSASQRARKTGGGSGWRSLFSTYGPFGGASNTPAVLGGPAGLGTTGDVDSDSSDDEVMKRPRPVGGTVGMTPTSAVPPNFGLFPAAQTANNDPAQAGTPANLGKIKDKQALADADPLGVDQHVTFDGVGGLQGHIDQLKEMVSLPLLYPEIFTRFKVTPPRGVLFHGPPGTGKTLLARALASSVSSQGRKVTFYMRKGADALSKWVGEAEKQLRLLFEEARKNQPSIIFFDEIDGLAPVRSSKQEQIHASIVSTLLALMDGMDGRGQVIVIGATNRPDSIDPALRRPGRFDREFYFPLPNVEGRRAILDIHTKGWEPPLDPAIKDELALMTKGYGGADLRALCTEAALNAVQRRYPQIYQSTEKLLIDPQTIEVTPRDFMISVKKMVPSSERSASSGASPLPATIEPLLRTSLSEIKNVLNEILPQKKRLTALEEAQYEDVAEDAGFGREKMQETFESCRVFRPRLLVQGKPGMGQGYLAAAVLNHFEGLHVQAFDLTTLLSDSASSPEATLIRLFAETKTHKPSVIHIPNIQTWYRTAGKTVLSTFRGLLRSLRPTDPVLLLGFLEADEDGDDPRDIIQDLFGYSRKNLFTLQVPDNGQRAAFFAPVVEYIKTAPSKFPDPAARVKRRLEILRPAPPEPEKPATPPSKEQLKEQKKKDRQTLNLLKLRLQPIMDQIRTKHKKFRTGVIDDSQIRYLYEEANPDTIIRSDLPPDAAAPQAPASTATFRPFEIGKDAHGEPGLVEQSNDKFFYNLDTVTIEKRLSNGYYKRPKDFLTDIKRLAKDAKTFGDEDRLLKANELLTNVEVDVGMIEAELPALVVECEKVYQRELDREKELAEKARKQAEGNNMPPPPVVSNVPHGGSSEPSTITASSGPIVLGEAVPDRHDLLSRMVATTPSRAHSVSTVLTNGVHYDGDLERPNGSGSHDGGPEADVEGDTPMGGVDSHPNTSKTHTSSSFGPSAQPRPAHSYTGPSQQLRKEAGMSGPLSQTDVITPMQQGSQAADYQNDASTTQTTSGPRNSGPSTGERDRHTQESGGPNLYLYDQHYSANGSEIPDTQENAVIAFSQGSGSNSNASQPNAGSQPATRTLDTRPPPPPPSTTVANTNTRRPSTAIHNLLNAADEPQPHFTIDAPLLHKFTIDVVDRTSGLRVEQLEQVNSVLMDTIWKMRGEWDRTRVIHAVAVAFNECITDMTEVGMEFERGSWGRATQE